MSPMITAANITNEQIRALRRAQPELLDTLMVAIHSTDVELRRLARVECAKILNARAAAATRAGA